jgi:hypothetical protein
MELFDRSKYWLLDLVSMGSFPIRILVHEELKLVVNKSTSHGLSSMELTDSLYLLFQEGMLTADLRTNDSYIAVNINPTRQDITNALEGRLDIHYDLTLLGGEYWEKFSKPQWNYYVSCSEAEGNAIIAASTRQRIEQYILLMPYFSYEKVIPSSERWEPLIPWEVTSWKTLPSGWQVTCKTKNTNEYLGKIMPSEYREWLDKIDNWYTNPFDTTDNSI